MIDNSCIQLEDGKVYVVVDKLESDGNTYIYLSNREDDNDICIRKQIQENNQNFLIGLDSNEEIEHALEIFIKKHPSESVE